MFYPILHPADVLPTKCKSSAENLITINQLLTAVLLNQDELIIRWITRVGQSQCPRKYKIINAL